ncbi:MAG: GMC family oxidoreductase [Proteobacteria bacterium]|nr:GMC family oxidoreductase [Pseudomonadota bacterium]
MNKDDFSCDALVIGTGLGASSFTYGLAKRGKDVVVIEQGDYFRPPSPDLAPLHNFNFANLAIVGGLSKSYGAAMYRLRERDFQPIEMERGPTPGWPISYADLEPFYGEAERLFKVHGSSEHEIAEPPRSTPWPYPPIEHQGPAADLVRRLREKAGMSVSYVPLGKDYDPANGGACVLCRHCDGYWCPRDAKMDAEVAALRPAVATGRVRVMTHTECLRILTSPDGRRATGALLRRDGREFTVHASIVGLGCGLRGTPILLYRSRTSAQPNGLGNGGGALGRYWSAHTAGWVFAMSPFVQRQKFHQKTFAMNGWYEHSSDWPYPTGIVQSACYIEPTGISRRFRYFAQAILAHSLHTFVMNEAVSSRETGFALSDNEAKTIAPPLENVKSFARLRRLTIQMYRAAGYPAISPPLKPTSYHSTGTARMGRDPNTSVCDERCQVHDVAGLHVVDSTVLPSSGCLNSGLTVAANALRAAALA